MRVSLRRAKHGPSLSIVTTFPELTVRFNNLKEVCKLRVQRGVKLES